jgi:hypothetical protein
MLSGHVRLNASRRTFDLRPGSLVALARAALTTSKRWRTAPSRSRSPGPAGQPRSWAPNNRAGSALIAEEGERSPGRSSPTSGIPTRTRESWRRCRARPAPSTIRAASRRRGLPTRRVVCHRVTFTRLSDWRGRRPHYRSFRLETPCLAALPLMMTPGVVETKRASLPSSISTKAKCSAPNSGELQVAVPIPFG